MSMDDQSLHRYADLVTINGRTADQHRELAELMQQLGKGDADATRDVGIIRDARLWAHAIRTTPPIVGGRRQRDPWRVDVEDATARLSKLRAEHPQLVAAALKESNTAPHERRRKGSDHGRDAIETRQQ